MSVRSLTILAAISALALVAPASAFAAPGPPTDQHPQGASSKDPKNPRVVAPRKKSSKKLAGKSAAQAPPPSAATPTSALPRPKSPAVLATKKDAKTGEEVIVITNDDLTRIFGHSQAKPQETDYSDFLKKYGRPQGKTSARQRAPAPTKAERIADLQQQIAKLKRRLLSLHNPYLPRVSPGEKEREAEKGMDNVQRVARVKAQIRTLEQKLVQLQSPGGSSRR